MFECFSKGTATFMILGPACTRNCRFCNISNQIPEPADPDEPKRLAKAVMDLNLSYVVITSVTRDDIEDGGASIFAETIKEIKKLSSSIKIEVLIPDFKGRRKSLETVLRAGPDVLNHNIETVPSLYHLARPQADYKQSLALLSESSKIDPSIPVKSGIMVGLGETLDEIKSTMSDLYESRCEIITIGQYLQPTSRHLEVQKYYTPDEFRLLKEMASRTGFQKIASDPFVRSSYKAADLYRHETDQSLNSLHKPS